MTRYGLLTLSLATLLLPAAAAEKRNGNGRHHVGKLPVNRWVSRGKLSGFKMGGTGYGGPAHGMTWCPDAKSLIVCGNGGRPAAAWRLDLKARKYSQLPPASPDKYVGRARPQTTYVWRPATYHKTADGREVVNNSAFNVNELCYDPDRKVVVGFSRGDTVEMDWKTRKWSRVVCKVAPPNITAGSLCYDPVNKEVVLATGGFSPLGGSDGTWLYDGGKKAWRRLAGPEGVERVRAPLAESRKGLRKLRWLTWKNLEFRATGREKLLDERAAGKSLAKLAAEVSSGLGELAKLAGGNSASAKRSYHKKALAAASALLSKAQAKLSGLEKVVVSSSPGQLEQLYRSRIVPATAEVDNALLELETSPTPRMSSKLVYDSKNKVMVCFGGDTQGHLGSDQTWVYHCEGRWWERRKCPMRPGARASRAMAFDRRAGVVLLIDSIRWRKRGAAETWTYDAGGNVWRRLAIDAPKKAFWLEYDDALGCLVAFSQKLDAAWALRLAATSAGTAKATPRPERRYPRAAPTGDYVLRDAATLGEIKRWKSEQDAWVKGLPANTWVLSPNRGTGRPNWGRTWSSIVYDPDRRQICYRDGGHGSYHGADTDHYDLATGRWFRSDHREGPPWPMGSYFAWGRAFSLAPWAIHTYKYALYYNPLNARLQRGKLIYDPDIGRWALEGYDQLPKGGAFTGTVVPGLDDALASVSAWTRYGVKTCSLWVQTAKGIRRQADAGRLPRYHDCHEVSLFADPKRKRLLFYGGGNPKPAKAGQKPGTPGLYALDLKTAGAKWTKLPVRLEGEKTMPIPSREVVYVPKYDVFLMLEGFAGHWAWLKQDKLAVWVLDAKDNTFRRLPLAKGPGIKVMKHGGVSFGLQYDPVSDVCFYKAASSPMCAFRYVPGK
jgi:hypothetical protein